MKPLKFKKIEIRSPRSDPHPEKSTTDNSAWRQGLFIIFEDYQGNEFDWMPRWKELNNILDSKAVVEMVNREMASNIMKGGKENMASLKEEAQAYEPKTQTKNIADLSQVSTEFELKDGKGRNKDTGDEFTYKFIEANGEEFRVPLKVLGDLKAILEENPELKTFKVKKTGTGLDTRYTVIPLS